MTSRFHPDRFRLILDCVLVVTVVLAIFMHSQPGHADAVSQPQPSLVADMPAEQQQKPGSVALLETGVLSDTVIMSNEMIAAVIASENAALTPAQYLTGLPIVTR